MTEHLVRDPVCGMEFSREQAATATEWAGRTYHFCGEACRESFEAEPRRFARREGKEE